MPIKFNGTTVTRVKFNGTTLSKVKFNGTTVFSSTKSLTGGSQSWNNTQTSQTATFCTWTDLGDYSSLSIPFSGGVSSANISGDTWSIQIRLRLNDGTTVQLANYTSDNMNINRTFTVNISSYSTSQLSNVKVQAVGSYSYASATDRFTYMNCTVGTSTAS